MPPPRRKLSAIAAVLDAQNPNPAPSPALLQDALTASAAAPSPATDRNLIKGSAVPKAEIKAGNGAGKHAGSKAGFDANQQAHAPSASAAATVATRAMSARPMPGSAAAPPITVPDFADAAGTYVQPSSLGRQRFTPMSAKVSAEPRIKPEGIKRAGKINVIGDMKGVWSTSLEAGVQGARTGAFLAAPLLTITQLTDYLEGNKTACQALRGVACGTIKAAGMGFVVSAGVSAALAAAPCLAPVVALASAGAILWYLWDASKAVYRLARCVYRRYIAGRPAGEGADAAAPDGGAGEEVFLADDEQADIHIQLEPLPEEYLDEMRCCVTLEPMDDPVVLSSGISVDASAFNNMPQSCPVTRAPVVWWNSNMALSDFRIRQHIDEANNQIPLSFPLRPADDGEDGGPLLAIPCWVDSEGVTHAEPGAGRVRNYALENVMRVWAALNT